MHKIKNYIFDPNRLIFYKNGIDSNLKSKINILIEDNSRFELLQQNLRDYNPSAVKSKGLLPSSGGICLTYNCQLRCNYCSFSSEEDSTLVLDEKDIELYTDYLIKNIYIKKLTTGKKSKLHVYFSGGGEPTYNWSLFTRAVNIIREKCNRNNVEYELELTTNGMLNDMQTGFIIDNFTGVMVSFDGIPIIQNANRKTNKDKNTGKIVTQTINAFDKADISLSIRTTLWQYDFKYMNDMASYIYDNYKNFSQWSLMPILATGRATDNLKDDYLSNIEYNFARYYFNIIAMVEKNYGKNNITSPLFSNQFSEIFCGQMNVESLWLMPGAKMITCLESKEYSSVFAEIVDGKLKLNEEFKSPILKKYIEKFSECKDCIAYRFCRGGCPLKFLRDENTSIKSADWECKMIKNYWKHIFENILDGKSYLGWSLKKISIEELPNSEIYSLIKI